MLSGLHRGDTVTLLACARRASDVSQYALLLLDRNILVPKVERPLAQPLGARWRNGRRPRTCLDARGRHPARDSLFVSRGLT